MWLSGWMRQNFALGGLIVSGVFFYMAIDNHWLIVPAVLIFGLTKLGVHLIPWRG